MAKKTQVATGAPAIKNRLNAFNKSIGEQVADYMRDPTRMLRGMQQRRSTVAIFGTVADVDEKAKEQIAAVKLCEQHQAISLTS